MEHAGHTHVYVGAQPPTQMRDPRGQGSQTVERTNEWMNACMRACPRSGQGSHCQHRKSEGNHRALLVSEHLFLYHDVTFSFHLPWTPSQTAPPKSQADSEGGVLSPAPDKMHLHDLGRNVSDGLAFPVSTSMPTKFTHKTYRFPSSLLPAITPPPSFNSPHCMFVSIIEWATRLQEHARAFSYSKAPITVPGIVDIHLASVQTKDWELYVHY